MFNRKPAPITTRCQWRRHRIAFNSAYERSMEFNGLILFDDGAFSVAERGFIRGEEIHDVQLGHVVFHRPRESDLLKITNIASHQVCYLEFRCGEYGTSWHQVLPIGSPDPTDEPKPLAKPRTSTVEALRRCVAAIFGRREAT